MFVTLVKLAGLAFTVACWLWARRAHWNDAQTVVVVWCAPLFVYPITWIGRRALDARPDARRAVWTNILVHYTMMIALGVSIFSAVRLVHSRQGFPVPIPQTIGRALLIVTGILTSLTVLNLAVRGLGAPFAAKLSSRLATDWMYRWTRNPMVLCTLAFLLSLGLFYQSLWFFLYALIDLSPGWIFFVRRYEERELEIRFGDGYVAYRARTPFLWPRKPARHGRIT